MGRTEGARSTPEGLSGAQEQVQLAPERGSAQAQEQVQLATNRGSAQVGSDHLGDLIRATNRANREDDRPLTIRAIHAGIGAQFILRSLVSHVGRPISQNKET